VLLEGWLEVEAATIHHQVGHTSGRCGLWSALLTFDA
jgi:hypothetical protein